MLPMRARKSAAKVNKNIAKLNYTLQSLVLYLRRCQIAQAVGKNSIRIQRSRLMAMLVQVWMTVY